MRRVLRITVAAAVASLVPASVAESRTYEVNKLGDPVPGACTSGHCTLREAVLAANASVGVSDVVVLPNRRRPYRLARPGANEDGGLTGDLDVTNDPLVIRHGRRGIATINAEGIDRVIDAFSRLTLRRIKVTGGGPFEGPDGGGIQAANGLVLRDARVSGNSGDDGGAIWLDAGNLTIVRSVLSRNHSGDDGGAITARGADSRITISRSRLKGNRADGNDTALGGALDLSAPGLSVTIARSTIAGNVALDNGGGINADNPGDLRIRNSTISGNRATGSGGGLYASEVEARLVNSTIADNSTAEGGGGIFANLSSVSLNGVTVVRNRANTDSVPLSETGGGLANSSSGFSVRNSLIALNRLGPGPRNDCTGDPFSSGGGNLLSSLGPAAVCQGFGAPKDKVRGNPKIARLKRNGGPTKTVALKRGSPAIGNARRSGAPSRDQRNRKRDRNPDSGAFERGA